MSWYVSRRSAGRQGLVICEQSGRDVAVAYDGADAPVLAAAPELLAALSELVDYDEGSSEEGSYGSEVMERCRAAIAKAKGTA